MTRKPNWLVDHLGLEPRVVTVFGAALLLLSGILTGFWLERQLGARAEQQAADSYSFLASNFSTMSAQLQTLSSEVGLVRALVDRPRPLTRGRLNPSDTSHDFLSVDHEIEQLSSEVTRAGGGQSDRALQLMLTAATLPGSDSLNDALLEVNFQQFEMILRLQKLKDSLASLKEMVDAGPASRMPGVRPLSAEDAARWAMGQVGEMRSRLDSSSAVLDRYEESVPAAAFGHRERTARTIKNLQWAVLITWSLGTLLAALGQFFGKDDKSTPPTL